MCSKKTEPAQMKFLLVYRIRRRFGEHRRWSQSGRKTWPRQFSAAKSDPARDISFTETPFASETKKLQGSN